jgi:hypothetical protein
MSTFDLFMILLNVVQLNVVLLNALAPKLTTTLTMVVRSFVNTDPDFIANLPKGLAREALQEGEGSVQLTSSLR